MHAVRNRILIASLVCCLVLVGAITIKQQAMGASAGIAYVGSTAYPNGGMVEVGTFNAFAHEDRAFCAIASPNGARAWVGLFTDPGTIVQVDLATMKKTGAIILEPGEGGIFSASIDPSGNYGYFTVNRSPGCIVRINLSTFTRAGNLDFPTSETANCLAIDPSGTYGYAGISMAPGRIVRVKLSAFSRDAVLNLPASDSFPGLGAVDGQGVFAYFIGSTFPTPRLIKVRLSDFTRIDSLALAEATQPASGLTLDSTGSFAYIPTRNQPGKLLRVNLSNFLTIDQKVLPANYNSLGAITISQDGTKALGVTFGGKPVVIDLIGFSGVFVSAATPPPYANTVGTIPLPGSPERVLLLNDTEPAILEKMDFSFNRSGLLVLDGGQRSFDKMLQDPDGLHCILAGGLGIPVFAAVAQENLSLVGARARPPSVTGLINYFSAAATDGERGYFAAVPSTAGSAEIHNLDWLSKSPEFFLGGSTVSGLSLFGANLESLAYNLNDSKLYLSTRNPATGGIVRSMARNFSQVTDHFSYLASQSVTGITPGRASADFHYILSPANIIGHYHGGASDYSPAAFENPRTLLQNSESGRLYTSTGGTQGVIYELDPNSLKVTQSLNLNNLPGVTAGEIYAGVLDQDNRFAVYSANLPNPQIIKHSLVNFQQADVLPTNYVSAVKVLDPDGGRLFAYNEPKNQIHKIRLTPRERMEGTRFRLSNTAEVTSANFYSHAAVGPRRIAVERENTSIRNFRSGFIDPARNQAWFGTGGTTGYISIFNTKTRKIVKTITSNQGELACAVADLAGGFGYFGASATPGKILKYRLSDGSLYTPLPLNSGENSLSAATIDPSSEFAYFAVGTSPAKIVIIQLSTFTRVGELTFNANEINISGLAIDPQGQFIYAALTPGGLSLSGSIVKINLATLSRVTAIGSSGQYSGRLAIDSDGIYLYASGGSLGLIGFPPPPGVVDRIRLSDFSAAGPALTLNAGEGGAGPLAMDPNGNFLLVGCNAFPSKVVKINLSTFTREGASQLRRNSEFYISEILLDPAGEVATLGMNTSPARFVTFEVFPKPLRLGIYRDYGASFALLWQSVPVAVPTGGQWISIPISQGTPTQLRLPAGNYLLAWQLDADESSPSYSPGLTIDGIRLPMPFGPFPQSLISGAGSPTNWTNTSSRWSAYLEYNVSTGVNDWAQWH